MRDIIAELEAKGVRAETIIRINKAFEAQEALAALREGDRQRQRKHRLSRDVTLCHVTQKNSSKINGRVTSRHVTDVSHTSSFLSSLEKEKKERDSRGKKIPSDWKPRQDEINAGLKLGYSPSQINDAAEDMRIWAQANGNRQVARKADWHLAFLAWLRRNKPKDRRMEGII